MQSIKNTTALFGKDDVLNLPISLPEFYKDCLDAWSTLSSKEVSLYEGIMNQYLWNNKYILCEGKSFI